MSAIWNIARLVLLESYRKKLYVIILVTFVLILLVPLIITTEDLQGKLQLVQSWSLSAITFFGIVITLFIGGTTLPQDIEKGRANLLVSKPVNRFQILAGKFLGLTIVLFLFVAVTGFLSLFMIRGISMFYPGPRSGRSILVSRNKINSESFRFYRKYDNSNTVYKGQTVLEDNREKLEIHGQNSTDTVGEWTFNPPDGKQYTKPPLVTGRIRGSGARTSYSYRVRFLVTAPVKVRTNQAEGEHSVETRWIEQQRVIKSLSQGKLFSFPIREKIVRNFDRFRVEIAPTNPASKLIFYRDSLQLTGPEGWFEWNYLKALFLIVLLFVLLNSLLIGVTPVLSAPINISLGLLFYLASSMRPFLVEALETTRKAIQLKDQGPGGHHHLPNDPFPEWLLRYSEFVSGLVLDLVPRIDYYSVTSIIVEGWTISGTLIYRALGETLVYVGFFFVAGTIVFQFRDLD